jgi:endonuclease/exonuclease/phosphatase family metal-dependent hydrolase
MGGIERAPAIHRFIEELDPTLLVCQEAKLSESDLPPGWKVLGQGGNRVASRIPFRPNGRLDLAHLGAAGVLDRYVLETVDGEFQLVNLHLPTPRPGIEAAIATKGRDLSELRRMIEIRAEASRVARRWIGERAGSTILAGDFNMPVESRIYRDTWSSFGNAFSTAGFGWGSTKQTRWFGARIDHILYSAPWRCVRAWVGPAMGSDHRPLIADLESSQALD